MTRAARILLIDDELAIQRTVAPLLTGVARDRVRLLDWMPQEELMRVYDQHGIFLFPSFFEGFGKAFLEAMSRGLCVVAADNGGAHDVITHEVDGLLAPTGDVEAVTKSSLWLIGNLDEAVRISHAAAETARSYTWDRVARETVAFYEDRIAAKARQVLR
jgi:glycosyltransferase involved in cell wall biosynthesis